MEIESQLITAGLNEQQAKAYLLLLDKGAITPPKAATALSITRTNSYKLLDKLVELGLARRKESNKKFVYEPNNPMALSNLVAEQRNKATAQENAVKRILDSLLSQYDKNTSSASILVAKGRSSVANAYYQQIQLSKPVYFIRSRYDIVSMGFDTMHKIRTEPGHHGQQRYGITPDITRGPVNPESDKRGNLTRTWVKLEDYDAPVEWSISGPSLLIVVFGNKPYAITIIDPVIAGAFMQLWALLDSCVRSMKYYKDLPRTNSEATPQTS